MMDQTEAKGIVKMRVLLNVLDVMDIKLSEEDLEKLRETHKAIKNDEYCAYRGFLRALHFDRDSNSWTLNRAPPKTELKASDLQRLSSDDKASTVSGFKLDETRSQLRDMIMADDSISNVGLRNQEALSTKKSNRSATNIMNKMNATHKIPDHKVGFIGCNHIYRTCCTIWALEGLSMRRQCYTDATSMSTQSSRTREAKWQQVGPAHTSACSPACQALCLASASFPSTRPPS